MSFLARACQPSVWQGHCKTLACFHPTHLARAAVVHRRHIAFGFGCCVSVAWLADIGYYGSSLGPSPMQCRIMRSLGALLGGACGFEVQSVCLHRIHRVWADIAAQSVFAGLGNYEEDGKQTCLLSLGLTSSARRFGGLGALWRWRLLRCDGCVGMRFGHGVADWSRPFSYHGEPQAGRLFMCVALGLACCWAPTLSRMLVALSDCSVTMWSPSAVRAPWHDVSFAGLALR